MPQRALPHATARPAPRTMRFLRAKHRKRLDPLLLQAVANHVRMHRLWMANPSDATALAETSALRWLWLLPALVMRPPAGVRWPTRQEANRTVEDRLTRLEMGEIDHLLVEYCDEHLKSQMGMRAEGLLQEPETEGTRQARACRRLEQGAIAQAKVALTEAGRAPGTRATREAIADLVALEVPQQELAELACVCTQQAKAAM